jgi:hypothetical protein
MDALLDHLRPLLRGGPNWDTERLKRRLAPFGFAAEEVDMMCALCAPQARTGLRRAVAGLSQLCPGDLTVRRWAAVLATWAARDARARELLDARPLATYSPVARFLAEVALRLPVDMSVAILERMLHLLNTNEDAECSAYTLYVAAKHLAQESAVNPGVGGALLAGDFASAVQQMAPPTVHEATVLETYRAALRNALGRRKVPARQGNATRKPSAVRDDRQAGSERESAPCSLRAELESLPVEEDFEPGQPAAHAAGTRARRATGLTTDGALGVPRASAEIDPLTLHILFDRLSRSDLDPRSQWLFRVTLTVMYCTGWPASVFTSLDRDGRVALDAKAALMRFTRNSHPALAALDIDHAQIRVTPEIVRQLRSVSGPDGGPLVKLGDAGQPLASRHIRCLLHELCASDTVRITMAMLRGAVWHAGRAIGWSPEELAVATCSWDPGFTNDSRYVALPATLDVRPLHEHMLCRLKDGKRQLEAVKRGEAFASL